MIDIRKTTRKGKAMKKQISKNGTETKASIRRRIAETWGFQYSKITLLEASHDGTGVCDWVSFEVSGITYRTDFNTLAVLESYSENFEVL